MLRYRTTYFVVLLLLCFLHGAAQAPTKMALLEAAIYTAKSPAQKLSAVLRFCDAWDSYSPDTLKKYAALAKDLATAQKDPHAALLADYYHAAWLFQANKVDSAFTAINDVLARYQKAFPYDEAYVKLFGLRGNALLRLSRMDELMANNFTLMQLAEQYKDTLGMARGSIGIGNVNLKLKKYDVALEWYARALHLMQNPVYKQKLAFVYNNIGITFYHLEKEDSALYYIRDGIRYSRQGQNLTDLANALFLYGGMLAEFHHLTEAETSFKEAVAVRKQIGDVYYLISDMAQFALFYADAKQPEKGIALCNEALAIVQQSRPAFYDLNDVYESLARNYKLAGDAKNLSETLGKQLALRDSIYKKNSAEAIAEMQAKYDVQKKETTIIAQKLQLVSKNYQLYGSLIVLMLVLLFSLLLFRQYRKRQQLKLQLMQEEEARRSEKAVAEAEESERKRIAADLHDSLGAYAASIASNLHHLEKTPAAANGVLHELQGNAQAIVAQLSDTIWVLKKDALLLTAISDRVKLFIQKMAPSHPGINIDVHEEIATDYLLPPAQAFHLFQIIKEAISNALKHSHCTQVAVRIEGSDGWNVSIADNGRGMQGDALLAQSGNGLTNMKNRADASGCTITWHAAAPAGTRVLIQPTTN